MMIFTWAAFPLCLIMIYLTYLFIGTWMDAILYNRVATKHINDYLPLHIRVSDNAILVDGLTFWTGFEWASHVDLVERNHIRAYIKQAYKQAKGHT